mmetsp:Transcript_56674/g.137766  ORF Transcript_56674/g.137766 Transcript_56674/m.137766 type:complete len:120 (+) Transcript_56674:2202-2561(+)
MSVLTPVCTNNIQKFLSLHFTQLTTSTSLADEINLGNAVDLLDDPNPQILASESSVCSDIWSITCQPSGGNVVGLCASPSVRPSLRCFLHVIHLLHRYVRLVESPELVHEKAVPLSLLT